MNDKPRRKSAGPSPVSAHPAFPAIVALWFAALLGLGSLVLPIALFERFTVASGLAEVYEAARPPLGVTARIAIALAAAAVGTLAGLAVARKVSAANAPRPVTRRAAALRPAQPAAAKRPISAHDELGAGGLDAESDTEERPARIPAPGRRRALSMTDESVRSDFLDFAPLPGQIQAVADEPLDLIAYEEPPVEPDVAPATAPDTASVFGGAFGSGTLSPLPEQMPTPETAMTDPIAPLAFVRREEPAPTGEPAASGLGALAMVELVERFAQALERHRGPAEAKAQPAPIMPEDAPAEAIAPSFSAAPFTAPPASSFSAEYAPYTPPVPAIPAALRPIGFDDDEPEAESPPDLDLTAALNRSGPAPFAAPFAPPPSVPAPFAGQALPDEDTAGDDEEPDQTGEEGYTSLLAMKSPFGLPREPVRIEDDGDEVAIEPVVVFPGQSIRKASPAADGPSRDAGSSAPGGFRPFDAPLDRARQAAAAGGRPFAAPGSQQAADPGETERALREALEKLQKMSGVG